MREFIAADEYYDRGNGKTNNEEDGLEEEVVNTQQKVAAKDGEAEVKAGVEVLSGEIRQPKPTRRDQEKQGTVCLE